MGRTGFGWAAVAAVMLAGCYASHGPAGGRFCGAAVCGDGEVCCVFSCDGAARCQSADLMCETPFCPDQCFSDADCAGTAFCITPLGTCGGPGTCQERPSGCERVCPGVCGCDGNDYCNECVANRMGVSVASRGTCGAMPCGGALCSPGERCCPGCNAGEGVCLPTREPCPDLMCMDECFGNEDCAPTEYCSLPSGLCLFGEPLPGRCELRPSICDDVCTDVCGCDGTTYCNACFAAQMGVNVGEPELCAEVPCGRGGVPCDEGEYCDLGPMCGGADGESCQPRPDVCADILQPVCGCDGMTYTNSCYAARAGATVASPGECATPVGGSCAELLAADPSLPSGVYSIVSGPTGMPVRVYCDMVTDGGGWTLVASSRGEPLDDRRGPYHADLAAPQPSSARPFVWDGMRPVAGPRADVRFTCRPAGRMTDDVDLSFYDVIWYGEWTTGSDADSCFSEANGMGMDLPEPMRRDNLSGVLLMPGTPWSAGYLEGEDRCESTDDFTVDLRDRGMDSNQMDGTDWGEDDNSPKCGFTTLMDGVFQIWVRE